MGRGHLLALAPTGAAAAALVRFGVPPAFSVFILFPVLLVVGIDWWTRPQPRAAAEESAAARGSSGTK